jgi:hypothetical protein
MARPRNVYRTTYSDLNLLGCNLYGDKEGYDRAISIYTSTLKGSDDGE